MMKEWTTYGMASVITGQRANPTGDSEEICEDANRIIRERNWLELVAMACNCGSTFTLCPTSDRDGWMLFSAGAKFDRKWSGTIADGHSHTAELAKALGLTEGGG